VGNTRVTKVGVVERGKLQRCEALEDQKDCGSKLFKVQGGAGGRFYQFRALPQPPYRGLWGALSTSSQGGCDFRECGATQHSRGRDSENDPERSACTCQLSEVWVRCLAMMQLHSASRKAPPFNPNHLRGAACDAVFVLVLAKARFRLARAKPKRHNGHG